MSNTKNIINRDNPNKLYQTYTEAKVAEAGGSAVGAAAASAAYTVKVQAEIKAMDVAQEGFEEAKHIREAGAESAATISLKAHVLGDEIRSVPEKLYASLCAAGEWLKAIPVNIINSIAEVIATIFEKGAALYASSIEYFAEHKAERIEHKAEKSAHTILEKGDIEAKLAAEEIMTHATKAAEAEYQQQLQAHPILVDNREPDKTNSEAIVVTVEDRGTSPVETNVVNLVEVDTITKFIEIPHTTSPHTNHIKLVKTESVSEVAEAGGSVVGLAAAIAANSVNEEAEIKAENVILAGSKQAEQKRLEGEESAATINAKTHKLGDEIRQVPEKISASVQEATDIVKDKATQAAEAIKAIPGKIADNIAEGAATIVEKVGEVTAKIVDNVAEENAKDIEHVAENAAFNILDKADKEAKLAAEEVVIQAVNAGETTYQEAFDTHIELGDGTLVHTNVTSHDEL